MFINDNPEINYVQILLDVPEKWAYGVSCDTRPFTGKVVGRPDIEPEYDKDGAEIPSHNPVNPEERFIYINLKVTSPNKLDSSILMNSINIEDKDNITFGNDATILEVEFPNYSKDLDTDVNI